MRNVKKSDQERAATRRAQNKRAAERRAARGMMRISLEVPREAIEEAERLGLARIGIVLAEPEADMSPVVLVRHTDGGLTTLAYRPSLTEPMG